MKTLTKGVLTAAFAFSMVACEDEFVDPDFDPTAETTVTPPVNLSNVTQNFANPASDGVSEGLTQIFLDGVFASINAEREAIGLEALIFDSSIASVAEDHNEFLLDLNQGSSTLRINHDGFEERADRVLALNFDLVGENVGAVRNFSSDAVVNALIDGWNNSPGHRVNIERDFTHTGIDILVDSFSGTVYATQIFARR